YLCRQGRTQQKLGHICGRFSILAGCRHGVWITPVERVLFSGPSGKQRFAKDALCLYRLIAQPPIERVRALAGYVRAHPAAFQRQELGLTLPAKRPSERSPPPAMPEPSAQRSRPP